MPKQVMSMRAATDAIRDPVRRFESGMRMILAGMGVQALDVQLAFDVMHSLYFAIDTLSRSRSNKKCYMKN
jgi:hypothetical protein